MFDALYRRGRAVHGGVMTLRWMPAEPSLLPPAGDSCAGSNGGCTGSNSSCASSADWRCGVVISSKVHKRAVQRNRLRRWLHGGLTTLLPPTPNQHARGMWLLISLKPGSASLERDRLLGECAHLLAKAGLIP